MVDQSSRKKISIVVPAYNEAELIELFLDRTLTVLSQVQEDWEVLFIDDGSKDKFVCCFGLF